VSGIHKWLWFMSLSEEFVSVEKRHIPCLGLATCLASASAAILASLLGGVPALEELGRSRWQTSLASLRNPSLPAHVAPTTQAQ
jgi:hypothetical protein